MMTAVMTGAVLVGGVAWVRLLFKADPAGMRQATEAGLTRGMSLERPRDAV